MADVLWGTFAAWADVVSAASLNALANASSVVSGDIDNTTARDQYAEVSFRTVTSTMAVVAGGHLAIYILPRSHDDTTFPNGATSGTTLPGASYLRGIIGFPAGTISPTGSVIVPIVARVIRIGMVNRLGVAFAAHASNMQLRYSTGSEAVV